MLVNNHLYPQVPTSMLWLRFPIQAVFVLWAYWYTGTRPSQSPVDALPRRAMT
jgi:hypothetical protein